MVCLREKLPSRNPSPDQTTLLVSSRWTVPQQLEEADVLWLTRPGGRGGLEFRWLLAPSHPPPSAPRKSMCTTYTATARLHAENHGAACRKEGEGGNIVWQSVQLEACFSPEQAKTKG